jgi:hypothetical protein
MYKEKFLLYFIYLAGIISLLVFITTKSEILMLKATEGMYRDGDLYRFAKVLFFKTKLPAAECGDESVQEIDADTAEIFVIGDSFMESCRGHKRFPDMLSEKLGKNVYPIFAGQVWEYFDPVYIFWKYNIPRDKRRIVLLERVERYIIHTYGTEKDQDTSLFIEEAGTENESFWKITKRRWFTEAEKNYEVFLTSSDYTTPFMELWNTFRFFTLRQISDETPVYSLNPPFLFEAEEAMPGHVTSFYYPHTDSLIGQIAENITNLKAVLLERYNAELVFMPVPNPYTLYHPLINNDTYDNYLPRLCNKLEENGVRTIQLYQKFSESENILFFPTDTHWNASGAEIAVDQAVSVISYMRTE